VSMRRFRYAVATSLDGINRRPQGRGGLVIWIRRSTWVDWNEFDTRLVAGARRGDGRPRPGRLNAAMGDIVFRGRCESDHPPLFFGCDHWADDFTKTLTACARSRARTSGAVRRRLALPQPCSTPASGRVGSRSSGALGKGIPWLPSATGHAQAKLKLTGHKI